jgi:hypothetical protein
MKSNLLILASFFAAIFCFSAFVANSNSQRYSDPWFVSNYNPLRDTTKTSESQDVSMNVENAISVAEDMAVWKEWKTVENHSFGKDRGNIPMIADLKSLHPYFRDKISKLIVNCKAKGIELAIVESFRTHVKQAEYYKMGKKYTRSAGGKSKHQYGLAVDVVPMINGEAQWDNINLWKKVGVEGEKLGLRWGGRWKSPYDPAHFEWSGGLTTTHLAAGIFPSIPAGFNEHYPCIEDDIKELRQHWQLWEADQLALQRKGSEGLASSQNP